MDNFRSKEILLKKMSYATQFHFQFQDDKFNFLVMDQ